MGYYKDLEIEKADRAQRRQRKKQPYSLYEILTDGTTVWVNGERGLIGRFGVNGIDIHRPPLELLQTGSECLFCTHEKTTLQDWEVFVRRMKEFYGVQIGERYRPVRFAHKDD